jgi:D-lyxose ketol-isomerase
MKRSEINAALKRAFVMLEDIKFRLPEFAYWSLDEWRKRKAETDVIQTTMLGWDVTDFGMNDFPNIGAVLFTIRNGLPGRTDIGTPFAEKLICLAAGQRLPSHYHAMKSEDIITRGGLMWMELYNSKGGKPRLNDVDPQSPVHVYGDGIQKILQPGERFEIAPGGSVSLRPHLYHLFGAVKDSVIGEVSSINDDNTDNFWAEKVSRFATIEEDETPLRPLCNEYGKLM